MYTGCKQNVHRMYTGCTQDVNRMYTGCEQNVNRMFTGCKQDITVPLCDRTGPGLGERHAAVGPGQQAVQSGAWCGTALCHLHRS